MTLHPSGNMISGFFLSVALINFFQPPGCQPNQNFPTSLFCVKSPENVLCLLKCGNPGPGSRFFLESTYRYSLGQSQSIRPAQCAKYVEGRLALSLFESFFNDSTTPVSLSSVVVGGTSTTLRRPQI